MGHEQLPRAFIYDRAVSRTTRSRAAMETRLQECATFARQQGWDIAGWYADSGDRAFTGARHPALDRAMLAIQNQWDRDRGVELILLVHTWDRISGDLLVQGTVIRLVRLSGGRTQTVTAGDDTVSASSRLRGPAVGLAGREPQLPTGAGHPQAPVPASRGGYGRDGSRAGGQR